jgi:hypothetical protein
MMDATEALDIDSDGTSNQDATLFLAFVFGITAAAVVLIVCCARRWRRVRSKTPAFDPADIGFYEPDPYDIAFDDDAKL